MGCPRYSGEGKHSKRAKGLPVDLEKDQRTTIGLSAGEVMPTDKG